MHQHLKNVRQVMYRRYYKTIEVNFQASVEMQTSINAYRSSLVLNLTAPLSLIYTAIS